MKLEMEGREPLIVLFGLPIVTAAIVLGSMYLGRMQAEATPAPPVYVEPNVTVTPRITAEMPQGAVRNEVQIPPAQIHEVLREVRAPDVTVVNKVEPTPVQVVMPKATGTQPQIVVVPTPLPLPMSGPGTIAEHTPAPATPPAKPLTEVPASTPSTSLITNALTTPPTIAPSTPTEAPQAKQSPPGTSAETAQAKPPPPPEPIKPTPVSTEPAPAPAESETEGKLLPPPRNLNGQPATK